MSYFWRTCAAASTDAGKTPARRLHVLLEKRLKPRPTVSHDAKQHHDGTVFALAGTQIVQNLVSCCFSHEVHSVFVHQLLR